VTGSVTTPVPAGFRIDLDPEVKHLAEDIWFGGSPERVLRLTPAGLAAWRELSAGPVASRSAGLLARRLTDAGLAHPRPPAPAGPAEVTVVIPVLDRADMLARCLSGLGGRHRVLVVDDGSADPRAIADVAGGHGARLVRRPVNGGPAAARNTALEHVRSELVAFVDSDCVPDPSSIDLLAAHFADPAVAAVAPRIIPLGTAALAGGSILDLGARPARVLPNTRVSFVPTATLVVRRAALLDVTRPTGVFDPTLRYGEDVDLVWRLHEAGWRVRYDPAVRVGHQEPATIIGLLSRRFRYGTSAAPLGLRYPTSVPPLVLSPWPTLTVAALLARRPLLAAAAFGLGVATMTRTLRRAGVPARGVSAAMLTAVRQTWLGIGRYGTQFAAPLLVLAARPRGNRVAAASLLLGPALTAWAAHRRHPVRFVLGHLADSIAYGAGVWAGCLAHRTAVPLRPHIAWRSPATTGRADHVQ
jgi:mycofactocin system glycosyltransferase